MWSGVVAYFDLKKYKSIWAINVRNQLVPNFENEERRLGCITNK